MEKMKNAYIDFFKRYFDFEGKSTVGDFWWYVLAALIVSFAIGIIENALGMGATCTLTKTTISCKGAALSSIYSLATFIPSLALAVRRLRDAGRSPLNLLWVFLPVIGWIILIVFYTEKSK